MQLIQYAPTTETVLKRAAADRAALDQQVLHPRPHAGEIVHQVVRRPGLDGVRASPGSTRTRSSRKKSFDDYMRDGPLTAIDVVKQATGESQGPRHRLLRWRHAAVGRRWPYMADTRRQPHRLRDASSPPRSTSPTRAISWCSSTRSRSPRVEREMARARLSRRQQDGARLQPAALERPDLALRHQQLPQGQGAGALRPAVLECRRHPHAGGQPLVLSAQLLSREQAHQGQDGDRQRQARSAAR